MESCFSLLIFEINMIRSVKCAFFLLYLVVSSGFFFLGTLLFFNVTVRSFPCVIPPVHDTCLSFCLLNYQNLRYFSAFFNCMLNNKVRIYFLSHPFHCNSIVEWIMSDLPCNRVLCSTIDRPMSFMIFSKLFTST